MSSPRVKSVLVVGVGPSGLAALKEMKEVGLNVTAVDTRSEFGGVFSPSSVVTCENLRLTISNMFMAFSDFPPIDKASKFWTKDEYFSYLQDYVNYFDLRPLMELETQVHRASLNKDMKWEVTTVNKKNESTQTRFFDYLIVASGANHIPYIPKGLFDNFTGQVMHASQYHTSDQVKDKRVLVVGAGESSVDVGSSAAKQAVSVTCYSRRFPDYAPRFIRKYLDQTDYDERRYMEYTWKPMDTLESITTSRIVRNLPLAAWSVMLQTLVQKMKVKHGPGSMQAMMRDFLSHAYAPDYFSSDTQLITTKTCIPYTETQRGIIDYVVAPKLTCQGNRVTFQQPQYDGRTLAHPGQPDVKREFDVIVACTGYGLQFNWISTEMSGLSAEVKGVTSSPRTWFKHAFPPGLGQYMAFVGFARPHSGGIPQCAEILCRYIAQLCIGNLRLPPDYPVIALQEGAAEQACFHQSPHYHLSVDYYAYMMSVAKLIGCTPKVPSLLTDTPTDWIQFWTFPLWPCFFRTQGVGANPKATKAVLSKFGPWDALAPTPLLVLELFCTFVMPFINMVSFFLNLMPSSRPLPFLYQFRMSKSHFLYQNSLTMEDFQCTLIQWVVAVLTVGHLVTEAISCLCDTVFGKTGVRLAADRKGSL